VLFATGIVIVGLIGIASILPVAIRNSTQSNTSAEGLSLGLAWADSFLVRGLHQAGPKGSQKQLPWQWIRDYGGTQGWEDHSPNLANPADIAARRSRIGLIARPNLLDVSTSNSNSSAQVARIWGRMPVCIDPYFFTADTTRARLNSGEVTQIRPAGYRAAVFPYYDDGHNPLYNPSAVSPPQLIDQPRMVRIGLAYHDATSVPYPRCLPVERSLVQNLFGSLDELVVDDYVDPAISAADRDSMPSKRLFRSSDVVPAVPLRALTQGQYTWMATVVPEEPIPSQVGLAVSMPAEMALVTFLVLHRHDHNFLPTDPTENLVDERITWVYPLSGNFVGGTGGRVRMLSNSTVSDNVSVGDWIMLGRYFLVQPGTPPFIFPFFRWYRIIGVDSEPRVGFARDLSPRADHAGPYGETLPSDLTVWSRDVVLEGPDFAFSDVTNGYRTPTIGTLVKGVVTVVERQVKLQ
jgi:hypothetical protein